MVVAEMVHAGLNFKGVRPDGPLLEFLAVFAEAWPVLFEELALLRCHECYCRPI